MQYRSGIVLFKYAVKNLQPSETEFQHSLQKYNTYNTIHVQEHLTHTQTCSKLFLRGGQDRNSLLNFVYSPILMGGKNRKYCINSKSKICTNSKLKMYLQQKVFKVRLSIFFKEKYPNLYHTTERLV